MVQNPTPYSIKATDMTDEMQAEVISLATEAVSTHVHARDIAQRCVLTAASPRLFPAPLPRPSYQRLAFAREESRRKWTAGQAVGRLGTASWGRTLGAT